MADLKFVEHGSKKLLRADFQDLYRSECSIQEASDRNQAALWFGVSKDFEGRESTRMLLTQELVRALLPHLQVFATTGMLNHTRQLPEAFPGLPGRKKKKIVKAEALPDASPKHPAKKKAAKKRSK